MRSVAKVPCFAEVDPERAHRLDPTDLDHSGVVGGADRGKTPFAVRRFRLQG
jgi:hypothetical protein